MLLRAARRWQSSGAMMAGRRYPTKTEVLQKVDNDFDLLSKSRVVVDIGCAPGEWLQVAAQHMRIDPHERNPDRQKFLYGIDKEAVGHIPGVTTVQGDFTMRHGGQEALQEAMHPAATALKACLFDNDTTTKYYMSVWAAENTHLRTGNMDVYTLGKRSQTTQRYNELQQAYNASQVQMSSAFVDGVMADLAPVFVAQSSPDDYVPEQVLLADAARNYALKQLVTGGWFVCNVYNGPAAFSFMQSLAMYFNEPPRLVKPNPSESVVVARGFIGRDALHQHQYSGLDAESVDALPDGSLRDGLRHDLGIQRKRMGGRVTDRQMVERGAYQPFTRRLSTSQRKRKLMLAGDGARGGRAMFQHDKIALLGGSVPQTR
eukprot:TRINITY_DN20095_c0_g1_i1.p1 TRINITY_DN20095_c0_g1~~TRINITY_DN20095_c0_g1_i1.p1  ORF type:complete len:374 (+),score=128.11 TRINITY_DN20095_c0_g1_i1:77-1198(+)